jgi:hypothetical protein
MKKLLPLILLFTVCFLSYGQKNEPDFQGKTMIYHVPETDNAELTARIMHTNYCLARFHRYRKTGRLISYAGVATTFIAIQQEGDARDVFSGLGGGLMLIGGLVHLSGEAWLKRINIEPYRDGVAFKFKF